MSNLGDDLDKAVGAPEPDVDLGALHDRARRRSVNRRRGLVGGSLAIVLLLGAVAFTVASDDGAGQQVTAGEGDAGATSSTAVETTLPPETTLPLDTTTVPVTSTLVGSTETTLPQATTVPETTVPPAGAETFRFSGSYTGKEHYTLSSTECPGGDTSHTLLLQMTGEESRDDPFLVGAWTYKADYCGHISGDSWHGSGEFGLTGPSGDTLQGTIDHDAPYPTDGVPYQVRITSGEGGFAGATGTCEFTLAITDKSLGSATQSGDFKCEIEVAPSSGGTSSFGAESRPTIPPT